jgi:hypothetical protein
MSAAPSPLAASGSAADNGFSDQPASQASAPCQKKTWIGIELKDSEGKPVPNEPYEITLPDGTKQTGTLDDQGAAGAQEIDPGSCQIRFPNLDATSWKPA